MARDTNFFINFANRIAASIHVAAPARIIKVNSSRSVDVVILYKDNGESLPPLLNVPVLRHVVQNTVLVTGDVVLLNFADRSLDNMNGSRSFEPDEGSLLHQIADAVVVGVF